MYKNKYYTYIYIYIYINIYLYDGFYFVPSTTI